MGSGENPRVLLYAHGFSVLFRLIAIWLIATAVAKQGFKGKLGELFTREPGKRERSRPWQDGRSGKPAGIIVYLVVIVTMLFTVGVVLRMGSGAGFLSLHVLIPEVSWALLIALIYLADDLFNKQLVVSSDKPTSINLGYNVGGLNFLTGAVFISAIVLLVTMNFASWLFQNSYPIIAVEWLIFLILGAIRLIYDVLRERKNGNPVELP